MTVLEIIVDNIVKLENLDPNRKSTAIVNAANDHLQHGGGVAGIISDTGGKWFQRLSDFYIRWFGLVETGTAALQPGRYRNLPANYVINAVGPQYGEEGENPEELLYNTYLNTLTLADRHKKIKTVVLPAISTGIFGFPKDAAARIVRKVLEENSFENLEKVVLCFYDPAEKDRFQAISKLPDKCVLPYSRSLDYMAGNPDKNIYLLDRIEAYPLENNDLAERLKMAAVAPFTARKAMLKKTDDAITLTLAIEYKNNGRLVDLDFSESVALGSAGYAGLMDELGIKGYRENLPSPGNTVEYELSKDISIFMQSAKYFGLQVK
jgi:O-acetyl-ADP-ribose deacetylase (regulator of RNase III)